MIRALDHHPFFVINPVRTGKSSIVTFLRQPGKRLLLDQSGFAVDKRRFVMDKHLIGSLSLVALLAGCSATTQTTQTGTAGAAATTASANKAPADSDADWETVFVPPPVGSHLGGGVVRVARRQITGNDENALLGNINRLNVAAGSKDERPFVVTAVSHATGVSERELQAQQDVLQLRFGELCAINAIARGDSNKVQEIARLRSKGRSWTDIAQAQGTSVGTIVKVAQNANEMTINSYSNQAERAKGGQEKLKDIGVKFQPTGRPNN